MRREEYEAAEQAEGEANSGTFSKASSSALAGRRIVSVRRRKKPAPASSPAQPAAAAGAGAGAGADPAPSYREQVADFYRQHNPEKLANLDNLLGKVCSFWSLLSCFCLMYVFATVYWQGGTFTPEVKR